MHPHWRRHAAVSGKQGSVRETLEGLRIDERIETKSNTTERIGERFTWWEKKMEQIGAFRVFRKIGKIRYRI